MTIKTNNKRPMIVGGPELNRRLALRRIGALAGLTAFGGTSALLSGCGGGGGGNSAPLVAPPQTTPSLGAHDLFFTPQNNNQNTISTGSMDTQVSGSTILACVSRGVHAFHEHPLDNKGNTPYFQEDITHPYDLWPGAGTALYTFEAAAGGNGHVVTVPNFDPDDEVTLAVVEVKNGGVIQDVRWNRVLLGNPITSETVTTTGPATLVAFWWGDADGSDPHDATPTTVGFTVVNSVFLAGNLIQCAVATKDVSTAGDYNVTWISTLRPQGAQMWLVAVQKAP